MCSMFTSGRRTPASIHDKPTMPHLSSKRRTLLALVAGTPADIRVER
jgi:hypothetical protein